MLLNLQTPVFIKMYISLKVHVANLRYFTSMTFTAVCVCVFSSHLFWTSSSLDVPAEVTQEEGHTGFITHLPSEVRTLVSLERRIQPFLSLVDRSRILCTNDLIGLHLLGILHFHFYFIFFSEEKS